LTVETDSLHKSLGTCDQVSTNMHKFVSRSAKVCTKVHHPGYATEQQSGLYCRMNRVGQNHTFIAE